ncbi:MAG: prenyltransferase/squalene oxidase repeat-containing protein, partial [Planctomycetota bacterium]
MKPLPAKLPPEQDDYLLFRKVVRKAPPVFIAILIILGLGVVLSRLVFTTYSSPADAGAFISMKGAMQFGEEETGEDEKEGAKGEDEQPDPDPPAKEPEEESPLEPPRWLDPVPAPAPAPVGPARTAPSKPEQGRPSAIKPTVSGGGPGEGEKGTGTGTGSPWGSREATGRGEGTRRFGGNAASESAVELGLNWLRRHQAENGVWRADGFSRQCRPGDSCDSEALDKVGYDGGVTALAVMAFLGAGYTHQEGRFRRTMSRALEHLLRIQKPSGRFGSENMYTQALAVIALAEAYGMTTDANLRGPLKKGLNFLVHAQQPQGGWTYDPAPKKERNDTSITAFAVMALKAARAAGLFVPERTLDRARSHFLKATRESGKVVYADAGLGRGRQGAGMV